MARPRIVQFAIRMGEVLLCSGLERVDPSVQGIPTKPHDRENTIVASDDF